MPGCEKHNKLILFSGGKMFTRILVIFLFSITISAQSHDNYIQGRILEKNTGKPLPGVNVYLNETYHGTTSDINGSFKIISIIPGRHELVASMIGYEVFTSTVNIESNTHMEFNVDLVEKLYEFGTVEVIAEKPTDWLDNYEQFKRLFLGSSKYSDNCEITNNVVLNFKKESGSLAAFASEPLIVQNNALGYNIRIDLLQFNYNMNEESVNYKIKTFYAEISTDDEINKGCWEINRNEAYYGSLQHFLKCLVNKRTKENGFDLKIVKQPAYYESDPAGYKSIEDDAIIDNDRYGLLTRIVFSDYLRVIYNAPLSNDYELSFLKLNYSEATLDDSGIPMETIPFKTYSNWAVKGVADLLPKYFTPD